jgi:hypothetical protein
MHTGKCAACVFCVEGEERMSSMFPRSDLISDPQRHTILFIDRSLVETRFLEFCQEKGRVCLESMPFVCPQTTTTNNNNNNKSSGFLCDLTPRSPEICVVWYGVIQSMRRASDQCCCPRHVHPPFSKKKNVFSFCFFRCSFLVSHSDPTRNGTRQDTTRQDKTTHRIRQEKPRNETI